VAIETADAVIVAGKLETPERCKGGSNSAASVPRLMRKKEKDLSKEDCIEVMGKVVEKFRAGMFTVELDAGKPVLATMAGKLRRNRIKVMTGDRVSLELSPYDLTKGRITYRHK
jgi:translation initiation factor IF-1